MVNEGRSSGQDNASREGVGGHCGCERVCGDLPAEQDRKLTICRGLLQQRLDARRERDAARTALAALIDAGEPFIESAFPNEEMTGEGLRLYNRWLAAMNDARHAINSTHEDPWVMDDGIQRARETLDRIGGFHGNGADELAPVAQALATIAVAEQLKRIADNLEPE